VRWSDDTGTMNIVTVLTGNKRLANNKLQASISRSVSIIIMTQFGLQGVSNRGKYSEI
jgi:hypothetical protein